MDSKLTTRLFGLKKKKNYRTSLLLLQPQGLGLDLNWLESFPDSSAHINSPGVGGTRPCRVRISLISF